MHLKHNNDVYLGDLLRPRYLEGQDKDTSSISRSRYKLENDPQCGLTTGGQDECYWDCVVTSNPKFFGFGHYVYFDRVLTNYSCLSDCYEEVSMSG